MTPQNHRRDCRAARSRARGTHPKRRPVRDRAVRARAPAAGTLPGGPRGRPAFRRTPEQEDRYWDMLHRAEVLYGLPNENPAGLADRPLQSPAGVDPGHGGRRRRRGEGGGARPPRRCRIRVTSSAGVHALPLAEFAARGILNGFKRSAELAQDQAAKAGRSCARPRGWPAAPAWSSPAWAKSGSKGPGSAARWA